MNKELVIGKKYGRLTYLREIHEDKKPQQGHFLCDCGNTKILRLSRVKTGDVKSCGCLQREAASKANKKHGMTGTREYRSWDSMMQRCNNPKNDRYADYGGRGIHVCQEWHDLTNFYADMGDRPDGATLDRIDNELGYSPGNCRWATPAEQQANRRKYKGGKSKYPGVTRRPSGKWTAAITTDWKPKYLGDFATEEEAAEAYQKAKRERETELEELRKIRGW
ncbi:TPA: AP2 domain-containing protein [Klebsiella variicola]|nr:AP2 domain-containing protein [Klebsiella variicola]